MLTRCPQCETIFKVSKKHISAAKGLVRCGSCKDIFNAKEHVIKSKKDLKKSIDESKSVISKPENTKVASSQPVAKKESNKFKATTTANDEADSFDFINDGFTSTISREKFEFNPPPTKKPIQKPDTFKRENSTGINFDSVFESDLSSKSSEDFFTIKEQDTSTQSSTAKSTQALSPASFTAKSSQPHKATIIQPAKSTSQDSDAKSNKTGNFLSQNVIDIKNAFTSISRKISSKVSKKSQEPKQSEKKKKKSIGEKLNESKFTNPISDTTTSVEKMSTSVKDNKNQSNKPAVMSLDSDTKIFTNPDNNLLNKSGIDVEEITIETPIQKPSAPKIKTKPQLKEDAALKLAIQLKKAALEKTEAKKVKTKTTSITDTDKNNIDTVTEKQKPLTASPIPKTESKKTKTTTNVTAITANDNKKAETINTKNTKTLSTTDSDSKPKLQLVESDALKKPESKKTDTQVSKEKVETSNEKTKETKDSKLIAKEEPKSETEEDENKNLGDGSFHIHMQSVDIPMVLRESLEELDLPTRSFEMTLFMVVSLILLSLGIALQFAVFRSIEVQQDYPNLKPVVSKICETFNCDYNGPRDIKKVQLISRDIRVHPNTKGALLISATIINNANYQQPYPNFSVRLSNLSGKTIALRYFSPDDYLGKLSNELLLMPPNQPIRVSLEVVDPGKEAINFEFKFLSRN